MSVISRGRRHLLLLIALLAPVGMASGQSLVSDWQAHTSYRAVRGIAYDGAFVWAATDGGVFSLDTAGGEISRYSVVNGLNSVEARTVAVDSDRALVWVGYTSGVLDRLDPATGTVTTFRDIERANQFSSRGINRIRVKGDSLLIATDFGVVVFDPERTEVRDSFTRLGTFSPAIKAFDVLVAPGDDGGSRIWVATADGVASASLAATNLQDPASWATEAAGFMTAGDDATALAWFASRIFVGTTTDLYERAPGGQYTRKFVSSAGVYTLDASTDQLYGSERFNLFVVNGQGEARILAVPGHQDPTGVVAVGSGSLWVGDAVGGLLDVSDPGAGGPNVSIERTIVPDGPSETQFSDLAFGPEGVLWAGGSTAAGSGFHRLGADGAWTTFTAATVPALAGTGSYTRITADGLGNGWAGSEGNGVVRAASDGSVERFTPANSSLAPAPGTAEFVIVGGLDADSDENLWVTTRATGSPIHVRATDGQWTGFGPYIGDGLTARATAYGRILADSFGQKWIIVRSENNFNLRRGLLVVDSGSSLTDQADDTFQFFDEPGGAGVGLPSTSVRTVVEDRDGLVWIGTDRGLAYFVNTGIVAADPGARAIWPQWADRSRGTFVLNGLQVNDIAVDPANRLWVATNEGAWLIEVVEGGYDLVQHFSTDNSPLFANEVLSVSVDPDAGRVFFATQSGLLSYQGDAIAPVATAQDLFVYPNPLEGARDVTIEGLVESAEVRIVTPSGSLIAAFSSRGGRATWNGRDRSGALVPTGVYLVIAVGDAGEGTSYGRLAVIR